MRDLDAKRVELAGLAETTAREVFLSIRIRKQNRVAREHVAHILPGGRSSYVVRVSLLKPRCCHIESYERYDYLCMVIGRETFSSSCEYIAYSSASVAWFLESSGRLVLGS